MIRQLPITQGNSLATGCFQSSRAAELRTAAP